MAKLQPTFKLSLKLKTSPQRKRSIATWPAPRTRRTCSSCSTRWPTSSSPITSEVVDYIRWGGWLKHKTELNPVFFRHFIRHFPRWKPVKEYFVYLFIMWFSAEHGDCDRFLSQANSTETTDCHCSQKRFSWKTNHPRSRGDYKCCGDYNCRGDFNCRGDYNCCGDYNCRGDQKRLENVVCSSRQKLWSRTPDSIMI